MRERNKGREREGGREREQKPRWSGDGTRDKERRGGEPCYIK